MLVVAAAVPFTALDKKLAKPIAGKAKFIAGFTGECCWRFCFGDELDDVGDDADEHDVIVSVDPLSTCDDGIEDAFVDAKRAAVAAAVARGFIGGRVGFIFDWDGTKPEAAAAHI